MSDHEIPLAIGLLKGISWVSSYFHSGLLLLTECQVITRLQVLAKYIQPALDFNKHYIEI